ncbi:porin [Cupriavidus sp. D39]|uniref:porin n=1 Tax=Cupriavidus sp. D39 TaxID=2997877 RepID=UPI002270209F|nr:porin [Cupriavidus sp. D39]MCY0853902.1 porin [Cupriavidus sp. D39]
MLRIDNASGWDEWLLALSTHCGLGCSTDVRSVQPSRAELWNAGELTILDLDIAEQSWSSVNDGDHRWIAEMLILKTITSGSLVIEQDGINRRFDPGSFVLIDPAKRLTEHFLGRVRVTPAILLGAAFDYTDRNSIRNDGGAKFMQVDLGIDYSISKSTDLYALAVAQRAVGHDSLGQASVASIAGFTPSATDKQFGVRFGVRHKF